MPTVEQTLEPSAVPEAPQAKPIRNGMRAASAAAGSLLTLLGYNRGGWKGLALAGLGGGLLYRGATGNRLTDLVGLGVGREAQPEDYFRRGIHVEESYTIAKPWRELYRWWRDLTNLPKIMSHLVSVTMLDDRRSHWVAKAPSIAGGKMEWDAEIINDEPDALIAWRSLPGADVHNAGSVRFVPARGDRGTEVRVVIDYIPPAGTLGKWVARLFGEEPWQQLRDDLRNFKRVMEAGEVPTIDGQPQGTCGAM